jgi:hypothetical protein
MKEQNAKPEDKVRQTEQVIAIVRRDGKIIVRQTGAS